MVAPNKAKIRKRSNRALKVKVADTRQQLLTEFGLDVSLLLDQEVVNFVNRLHFIAEHMNQDADTLLRDNLPQIKEQGLASFYAAVERGCIAYQEADIKQSMREAERGAPAIELPGGRLHRVRSAN